MRSLALPVALTLALGCATAGRPAATLPPPIASALAVELPVAETFRAPFGQCPAPTTEPRPARMDHVDDAPLHVSVGAHGFTLATRGATAGRVLVELARVAHREALVLDVGSTVRVWAQVDGRPFDEVAGAVARAAGLVLFDEPAEPERRGTWMDPDRARALHRAELELSPLETRMLPSRTPRESARVLAAMTLSCAGSLVASPRTGFLVATDLAGNLHHTEALLADLERGAVDTVLFARDTPAPVSTDVACDAVASALAPNLAPGATSATGSAAGDMLLSLATRSHASIVVGCGGDRPAFYLPSPGVTLEAAATALGLAPHGPLAFTSTAVAAEIGKRQRDAQRGASEVRLRSFRVAEADDLELTLRTSTPPFARAVASYSPHGLLVAKGTREQLDQLARVVEGWQLSASAPPRPRSPSAPPQ